MPAPDALDRLVDALLREPKGGIAGPSTNRAWNEQCAFPEAGGTPSEVARTARRALRRYRDEVRTLEPLHSLADFCYAVRREVIDAVGAADEGYALGPCWELEYNVRAARAAFRCLWVCGAYVWRPEFTARRRLEERRRFEASKRRYQDSVCALRLRGEKGDYEAHCRGEDCEHFAPAGLMRVHRALPTTTAVRAVTPPRTPRPAEPPLVTCVMPTRDRREFALQAVRLFQRQDYPNRELVVVDDGDDDLERALPADPRIRYVRAPRGASIGAKRNLACEAARGAYVAQWDDDDWYGPGRLSAQLAPLLARRADVTGLVTDTVFDLPAWRFWRLSPALHRRLFTEDVHGGTLVYARRVWERLARYPDLSLAEDARFLTRAKARGARLERIDGRGLFVYLRHETNAWRFGCGTFVEPAGWHRADEPAFPPEDRAFYLARSRFPSSLPSAPLVTCLMPTRDRHAFVPLAIECFLRQDYAARELVIVDDGHRPVEGLVPADPRIRYERLERPMVLGAKRNLACRLAHGELIAHWDDDDWSAPRRLAAEVAALERRDADVAGLHELLFYDPVTDRAWLYAYPRHSSRPWVAGGTLCYRKSFWERHPFPEIHVGEDTRFVWAGRTRIVTLDDASLYTAVVHSGNTSVKRPRAPRWRPAPRSEISALLGADLERVRAAASAAA